MKLLNRFFKPELSEDQFTYLLKATFANMASTLRKASTLDSFGKSHNQNRDINDVFGYPSGEARSYSLYSEYYKYNALCNRIITCIPRSCWRDGVTVLDNDKYADFLSTLQAKGLFVAFEKADILNRIGHYSVLYIGGLDDNDAKVKVEKKRNRNIDQIFFAPYSEEAIQVTEYDEDPLSSRYGLPLIYELLPGSNNDGASGVLDTRQARKVHWSRVVHLAEGSLDNSLVGTPELEPIITNIIDIIKTVGGAAEGFYRATGASLTMDVDKDAYISEDDMDNLGTNMQQWLNKWRAIIGISGAKLKPLNITHGNPEPIINASIKLIAAAKGIPLRVLTGEGGGVLAGTEDKGSYNQIISDRQNLLCEAWLNDCLHKISAAGYIEQPKEPLKYQWPVSEVQDEKSKSEVGLNRARAVKEITQAIATYSGSNADTVLDPETFKAEVLGYSKETNKITLNEFDDE